MNRDVVVEIVVSIATAVAIGMIQEYFSQRNREDEPEEPKMVCCPLCCGEGQVDQSRLSFSISADTLDFEEEEGEGEE